MRNKALFWLAFFILTIFEAAQLVYAHDAEEVTSAQVAPVTQITK